jgi:hypothetical protein
MRNTKDYRNEKWFEFRDYIFQNKGKVCEICNRDANTTVIQCHHEHYDADKEIWEYDIEDITVVCKGCHAREHEILEPNDGWSLIQIIDNGAGNLVGKCEREKGNGEPCNEDIRYEHVIVHPKIHGEKIVGSTCIDHLTEKSKGLAKEYRDVSGILLKINKKIDDLDKPWITDNFSKKPWKLVLNKKREYELQYRLKRNIDGEELKIISTIKKEKNGYSANLSINSEWYNFKNKSNGNEYSRIYSSLKDIQKMLLIIQEQQSAKMKNKTVITTFMNEELKNKLKEMKYSIKKQNSRYKK